MSAGVFASFLEVSMPVRKRFDDADLNTLPEECQETQLERKKRLGRERQAKYRLRANYIHIKIVHLL